MKKLAEISRLTLEAFTSEEATIVKNSTLEDINKVGDLGLEMAKSNPELKEKIVMRELRDNPHYLKGIAEHIITEEPEMADAMVKSNVIRYAENRGGVLTVEQGYISPRSTVEHVYISADGNAAPSKLSKRACHDKLSREHGFVYLSNDLEKLSE